VVVTDLRMPNVNGHVLASNLLLMENRPAIVIVTGILEPKIAKDLSTRGVDSIEFKPVNYPLFAAKVKGLVDSRSRHRGPEAPAIVGTMQSSNNFQASLSDVKIERTMIGKQELEGKLTQLTKILPISTVAFDIFNMTSEETYENAQIAAAAARDATLGVDILRIANSSYYNYSSKKIVNMVDAISHIGQKRVGELALATNMMVAMTPSVLPWMDIELTWHRSMSASVAIDLLAERVGIPQRENRLFLSSISYPLGRIALCMLYPNIYQKMIKLCQMTRQSLRDEEKQFFAMQPEQVMGFLFKTWNIPSTVFEPLVHSALSYSAIASLGEPLSTKVELLKVGILIAEISVGKWESWDRIEIPPVQLLSRLGIGSYEDILKKTKTNSQDLINFREDKFEKSDETKKAEEPPKPARRVNYCNLAIEMYDFMAEIISRSGLILEECRPDDLEPNAPAIVNCIGVPAHRMITSLNLTQSNPKMLFLTASTQTENLSRFGRVFSLPASYSALQKAYQEILK
jgi:HD-like signal output (HDOD) protein